MPLYSGPLLSPAAALLIFVPGGFCDSLLHSLSYFSLHLPQPSQGLSQSFFWGYLDDQLIVRYDSLTGKMGLLVPWVEEAEAETILVPEWVFRTDLEKLSNLDQQTGGLPTWQVTWGCELREDGSKGGFLHYGYNGEDFISFDKETLRWVTAQPLAQKAKEEWEEDPGWSQKNKIYLEETCIKGLQRYLSYRKERTEPPVGKVTHKIVDNSLEVLICQIFGFYPKEIQATWTRDREVCQYETLHRNVVPNSDGTYYVRISIEIDPKERHHFQCHLEHEGLQEPLILAFKEERATFSQLDIPLHNFLSPKGDIPNMHHSDEPDNTDKPPATIQEIPVGILATVILGLEILFLCYWCWRCRDTHQEVMTHLDHIHSKMLHYPLIYGTENGIKPRAIALPRRASEHNPPCDV